MQNEITMRKSMKYEENEKMVRIQECVLYRDFQHGEILEKMTALMNACESGQEQLKEQENTFFECMNGLVEMAGSYGFSGNLGHNYLKIGRASCRERV